MNTLIIELLRVLRPRVRRCELDSSMELVSSALTNIPVSPFHLVLGLSATTPPQEVAAYLGKFIEETRQEHEVEAIYAEMNGFDINTDRWFYNLFAYRQYR